MSGRFHSRRVRERARDDLAQQVEDARGRKAERFHLVLRDRVAGALHGEELNRVALSLPRYDRTSPQPCHHLDLAAALRAIARRYAEVLARFVDAARIDRAVLIGNSIGGAAAVQYAASHPERVAGIVLENPGGLDVINDRMGRIALGLVIQFFKAGARGAWWFPAAYRTYYSRVLAAWAKNDQLVQWKRNEPTVRKFPDLRVELFDAGHAAHLERPNEFAATVDRFLTEIGWNTGTAIDGAAAR
ncbi:MAG TPA: alpha/beta fold hydrolase [Candidatus Binataceae bacterium]|nr:alpha/beta fold hydrolase [Candidatus Binataceae bacterium]